MGRILTILREEAQNPLEEGASAAVAGAVAVGVDQPSQPQTPKPNSLNLIASTCQHILRYIHEAKRRNEKQLK